MTAREILGKISEHQVVGLMFHEQMANYYHFLGFHGFKRWHEFQYLEESISMRATNKIVIEDTNMLMLPQEAKDPKAIPTAWLNISRFDVTEQIKKDSLKNGFKRWHDWEISTIQNYQKMHKEFLNMNETNLADYTLKLIKNAEKELKKVKRVIIKMNDINYDLGLILLWQKPLHDKYKKKTRKIGSGI